MNGETEISLLQALLVYAWLAILIAVHYLAVLGRYGYPFKWRNLLIVFLIARIPIVGLVYYYWAYKGFGVWRRERSGGTKPTRFWWYVLWGVIALVACLMVVFLLESSAPVSAPALILPTPTPAPETIPLIADWEWVVKSILLSEELKELRGEIDASYEELRATARPRPMAFGLDTPMAEILRRQRLPTEPEINAEWCRIIEEKKEQLESLLSRWRALPNPQSPDLVEADNLFEEALQYVMDSLDKWITFCVDGDATHLDEGSLLLELSATRVQESKEALERYLGTLK